MFHNLAEPGRVGQVWRYSAARFDRPKGSEKASYGGRSDGHFPLDFDDLVPPTNAMQPSIEQLIREFKEASAAIRLEIGDDPAKARAFLESAGIKLPPVIPSKVEGQEAITDR